MTMPDVEWLLAEGSAPVRYRTLRDILAVQPDDPELLEARREVLVYPPALEVAGEQKGDGSWGGRLHTGDSRVGVRRTTEIQFPRLVEYGWGPQDPPVQRTARLLLDNLMSLDPGYLELIAYARGPKTRRYVKWFGASIAAGLLAHAGLGTHPAVTDVAESLLVAAYRYVSSPAAEDPVGGEPPVIRPEAYDAELGYPALPDLYMLQLWAHCPAITGHPTNHRRLRCILDYVLSPAYTRLDQRLGFVDLGEGRPFVKGWKILLPDAAELSARRMWAYGLVVLEFFALLGAVQRYPVLSSWLEWLLAREDPKQRGTYELPGGWLSRNGHFAERVRLASNWRTPPRRVSDLTFRIARVLDLVEGGRGRVRACRGTPGAAGGSGGAEAPPGE